MKQRLLFIAMSLMMVMAMWAQNDDMLSTPLTIEAIESGEISFDNKAVGAVTYRINDAESYSIASSTMETIVVNAGDKVMFYGNNESYTYLGRYSNISCTSDCYIYGNIMSLVSSTDYINQMSVCSQAFQRLFANNIHLKNHSSKKLKLPATIIARYCYMSMFEGCTSLTETPDLPAAATSLDCYYSMFEGCTGLTKISKISATTMADYCCYRMFYGCTSLTETPDLPATTTSEGCYYSMFEGCTNLTKASKMSATVLAERCCSRMYYGCTSLIEASAITATTLGESSCASMFEGCTSLKEAPAITATTLSEKSCNSMFLGCTSLKKANKLSATSLDNDCYFCMFYECANLTEAPELPATTLAYQCYTAMFYGCTSLAVAPKLPAMTLANNCYYHMFQGCTSLTTAPELPATELLESCYSGMFMDCTSLTASPVLPAKTLVDNCYGEMFMNCTSLNRVTCLATSVYADYCTDNWLMGVPNTGTFTKVVKMNDWSKGDSGIPSGWSVKDASASKTITAAGYATYCYPYALDFSSVDGLTAYIAKVGEQKVIFEAVSSVPANTGILLKGAAKTYDIPVVGSSYTDVTDNAFIGMIEAEEKPAGIFVLMNGANGVGFYKTKNAFIVGANTAYLPAIEGARTFISFDFNDEATSISKTFIDEQNGHAVYNMNGQRIAQPTKGLYIKNNKKVVVK